MKQLFAFGSFAHDSQRVLAAVQRLAIVGIELPLNGRLRVPHIGIARELGIAIFTYPSTGTFLTRFTIRRLRRKTG